jgi:putative cardiolipin synthase
MPALLLTAAFPLGCGAGGVALDANRPTEIALPVSDVTWLDRTIAPREAQHPGESAFRLVSDGHEAFVIRSRSAQLAMRSLDVQTFIWRDDLTGKFLAHRLLEAADRGVRVRILVDGIGSRDSVYALAALARHEHISVRVFNPLRRSGGMPQLLDVLLNFDSLNRRMHNKTWIADNRMAVVGGRNIGDEYHAASDTVNFVDLDFAMFGPIVRAVSASFDDYWNSAAVVSLKPPVGSGVIEMTLAAQRLALDAAAAATWRSPYAAALLADDAVQRLVAGDWPMQWTANYLFVADDPLKAMSDDPDLRRAAVRRTLLGEVRDLQEDLVLVSPYFVPGDDTTALLVDAVGTGKRVRVLTNSLAATDMSVAHGVYARHREALLAGGVRIWELKAEAVRKDTQTFAGAASLHTKALLIDRRKLFVGSYNLDPRSAWINCEQGVLVANEALASSMEDIVTVQIAGSRAWRVTLEDGDLRWTDGTDTFTNDPHSSIGHRLLAWLARVLHLDAHL